MGWAAVGYAAMTALSAAGTQQAGKAQQAQLDYQAQQAEADAKSEREYGIVQAQKVRRAGAQQLAETRASYAASGVDVTTGTPQTVNRQIMQDVEEDALNTILDSNRRAQKLQQQAQGYRAGSSNVGAATTINTGATLLGGAAKSYEAYDNWKRIS